MEADLMLKATLEHHQPFYGLPSPQHVYCRELPSFKAFSFLILHIIKHIHTGFF